jgi:hypothetical protein
MGRESEEVQCGAMDQRGFADRAGGGDYIQTSSDSFAGIVFRTARDSMKPIH